MVNETHRFRNLPDFQMKARDVPIFKEIEEHVLKPSYASLKGFNITGEPPIPGAALPGPPAFAAAVQPYHYEYNQAAGVRFTQDAAGNIKSSNSNAPMRRLMKPVDAEAEEVPQGPPPELKAANPSGTFLPKIIADLKALLDERPLVTRRVAQVRLPHMGESMFREATQWVGYTFKAGPWRDCLIKYGVDPRSDPKYRKYQTLMFQLDKRAANASGDKTSRWNRSLRHIPHPDDVEKSSHLFDGKHITLNGKTWQVCDITDPVVKDIFDTEDIRSECDLTHFGWYHDGTVCKARVIMREKMEKLFEGQDLPHGLYAQLAKLPEDLKDLDLEPFRRDCEDHEWYKEACTLAAEIGQMARAKKTEKKVRDLSKSKKDDTASVGDDEWAASPDAGADVGTPMSVGED